MTTAQSLTGTRFPEFDPELRYRMIIDGELVQAADGQTYRCLDPFEDAEWGYVPVAGAADVDRAVHAAQAAFPRWAATSPFVRVELFRRWGQLIREHSTELARLQVHENGKTIAEMGMVSPSLAQGADYIANAALMLHGQTVTPIMPGHTAWSERVPVGVVAAIAPWNNPLGLLQWKLFGALAAGNTIVVKPSEVTPVSTLRLVELALEAGFPPGVVNVVTGAGATGSALVEHPGIDKVAFTGSTATGRAIAQAIAPRHIRATLELGGKGANIVFADSDLDRAAEGLLSGIIAGTGQACNAGSRILIQDTVRDEVLARLEKLIARVVIGDPLDPSTQIGPLASRPQYSKVTGYLGIAESENSTSLITGGRCGTSVPGVSQGLFVEPTLFDTPDRLSRLRREEIFGPVGSVISFHTEDEAIQIANDTEFGLVGGLWTRDLDRARRVSRQIDTGVVWINTWRAFSPNMPFGGRKSSGLGHEMGLDIFEEYTELKAYWHGPDNS